MMSSNLGRLLRSGSPEERAFARRAVWAAIEAETTPTVPASAVAVARRLGCCDGKLRKWVREDKARANDLPSPAPLCAHRWTPGARRGNRNGNGYRGSHER